MDLPSLDSFFSIDTVDQVGLAEPRVIKFHNRSVCIPKNTKWVAINEAGDLFAYLEKPEILKESHNTWSISRSEKALLIGWIRYVGNWKLSLTEVPY